MLKLFGQLQPRNQITTPLHRIAGEQIARSRPQMPTLPLIVAEELVTKRIHLASAVEIVEIVLKQMGFQLGKGKFRLRHPLMPIRCIVGFQIVVTGKLHIPERLERSEVLMEKLQLHLTFEEPRDRILAGGTLFQIADIQKVSKSNIIIAVFLGKGVLIIMRKGELCFDVGIFAHIEIQSNGCHLLGNGGGKHLHRLIVALRHPFCRSYPCEYAPVRGTACQNIIPLVRAHIGEIRCEKRGILVG